MPESKDFKSNNEPKINQPEKAWIYKEKEKQELESRIVGTLKSLNGKLTKKEIMELFHRVEVGKWLDWLKKELEKEVKLWWKDISEEVLKAILDLIKESKELAQKGIEELRLELDKLNESKFYEIDKKVYLSSRYNWIKKLEDSELGKNIIIDIAWIGIGILDSAVAIFQILLWLIKDIFFLPRDIVKNFKK